MARKRHVSRIVVFQVLFEKERRDCDLEEALFRNASELGEIDEEFALKLLHGILEKEEALKEAILKNAPEWTFERMDPIARCLLMVGAYEIMFGQDAPPPVVMNESIEIAKEYGTEETGKFVNGVLNAMAQQ